MANRSEGQDGPLRRCPVCRETAPASELIRFVADPSGGIHVDGRRKLGGRGVNICWNGRCIDRAGPALSRGLGLDAPPPADDVRDRVREELVRELERFLGLCQKVGQLKSGADTSEGMVHKGWAQAVVLSEDAGDALVRRFTSLVGETEVSLHRLPFGSDALGGMLGTAPRSVAVLGRGRLASSLLLALQRAAKSL